MSTSLRETLRLRTPALQSPSFRLLWIGQLVSMIGSQMQLVAIDWHIYHLLQGQTFTTIIFGQTYNLNLAALGLGGLGLSRVIPIVILAMLGGVIADSKERRKVLLVTQSILALIALVLATTTLINYVNILLIYLLSAATAGTTAFDNPARQSLVPNLVPRQHLTNAVSLNTLMWQIGTIVGPALAGIMLVNFNIGWIYIVNAVSFSAVLYALYIMPRYGYKEQAIPLQTNMGFSSFLEGWNFVRSSRIIWGTMLLDFFATFFSSARSMLPIVAAEVLKTNEAGYGILATAQSVGAVIAGLITSLRGDIQRQGYVLLVSVAIYGVATALFGWSTWFWLSYFLFALTGAADTVSTVIRGTVRQLLTPDHLRGRMVSVNMIFFMGGPQLGELEAGVVAAFFGAPVAIVTGGIATVVMTLWVAWKYPRLREYRAESEVPIPNRVP
jgi:MFS family permease